MLSPLENVVLSANEIYVSASLATPAASAGNNDDAWGDDWNQSGGTASAGDAWGDDWSNDEKAKPGEENSNNKQPSPALGAIRVRVTRGNQTVVDQTIWQSPGDNFIRNSVSFEAPAESQDEHEHEN